MKLARSWLFLRKWLLRLALLGLGVTVACTAVFLAMAWNAQPDFQPINEPVPSGQQALMDQIPKYRRPESATYLTYPEWYLVFNPQEYAQALQQHPASQFAYFKSISQFWVGYAQVFGITRKHYPFNAGDHLMEVVIGTSTTVEYVIKGLYENTIGRAFEWLAGERTPEENVAADVARKYGEFIPTQPWFDFPFGAALKQLWSGTSFWGPHFPRKLERKFFLSLEYGVKVLYAGVIRLASHSVYGVADTEIYVSVANIPEAAFQNPEVKKIKPLGSQSWIITLPHYQGFTDTVPGLARQGVQFLDIAGNDEILVTITAPASWHGPLQNGHALFQMELLTGPERKRVAMQVPVKSLGAFLRECDAAGLKVEHLFDY